MYVCVRVCVCVCHCRSMVQTLIQDVDSGTQHYSAAIATARVDQNKAAPQQAPHAQATDTHTLSAAPPATITPHTDFTFKPSKPATEASPPYAPITPALTTSTLMLRPAGASTARPANAYSAAVCAPQGARPDFSMVGPTLDALMASVDSQTDQLHRWRVRCLTPAFPQVRAYTPSQLHTRVRVDTNSVACVLDKHGYNNAWSAHPSAGVLYQHTSIVMEVMYNSAYHLCVLCCCVQTDEDCACQVRMTKRQRQSQHGKSPPPAPSTEDTRSNSTGVLLTREQEEDAFVAGFLEADCAL